MELLVVGAGEMGRWFGSHFGRVAYADRDRAVAEAAAERHGGPVGGSPGTLPEGRRAGSTHAIDAGESEVAGESEAADARAVALDTSETFDAVCIAVPIPVVEEAVAEHADRAEHLVCDVSGVMAPALDAMRRHAPNHERLSLHPLFSARTAPGRVAAVTDADGESTQAVYDALASAGNELFETTPVEHDEAMRTVQARAHAAVLAFGLARDDVDPRFHTDVSGALADLVDRVTSGSPRVYADIQATFDGADDVAAAAARIARVDGEPDAFADLYRDARIGPADGDDESGPDAGDR